MTDYPFPLPPPLALARPTDAYAQPGIEDSRFEPKFDGFRACVTATGLWSRAGKSLSRYFPEVTRNAAQRLPPGAVLDAELVAWNRTSQTLDFPALGRRFTAGKRVNTLADRLPAQLVAFDLLAHAGEDLRPHPLDERRARLQGLLTEAGGHAITLCQQTAEEATARQWFIDYTAGGLEGIIIKRGHQRYPTTPGQRIWLKTKQRESLDCAVTAVTGDPAAPPVAGPGPARPRRPAPDCGGHLDADTCRRPRSRPQHHRHRGVPSAMAHRPARNH